jgi:putative ABC transport system substrate-binding protein
MGQIGRRRFLLVAGAMLAVPRVSWGQAKGRLVRIATLVDGNKGSTEALWRECRARLRELGWVERENVLFIQRFSQGARDRIPAIAAELVTMAPDVIVTVTTPATRAVMKATSTIPIVFLTGDPLGAGLVSNLARPGGNATGQSIMAAEVSTKWLEFLIELVPRTKRVAMLGQANNRTIASVFRSLQSAAKSHDISVRLLEATEPNEVSSAFETMVRDDFDGFIATSTPIVLRNRRQIVDLAAHHRLPGIYPRHEYSAIGGLLSYEAERVKIYRSMAEQVDRVLKGANPGDLPVQQPTKFTLAINLRTAKALGLRVPQSILLLADQVVE